MVGLAALVLVVILIKRFPAPEPSAGEIADRADTILQGRGQGWDVDDYENLNPRDPVVHDLWRSTLFELPETWMKLPEDEKVRLREVIRKLREFDDRSPQAKSADTPRS